MQIIAVSERWKCGVGVMSAWLLSHSGLKYSGRLMSWLLVVAMDLRHQRQFSKQQSWCIQMLNASCIMACVFFAKLSGDALLVWWQSAVTRVIRDGQCSRLKLCSNNWLQWNNLTRIFHAHSCISRWMYRYMHSWLVACAWSSWAMWCWCQTVGLVGPSRLAWLCKHTSCYLILQLACICLLCLKCVIMQTIWINGETMAKVSVWAEQHDACSVMRRTPSVLYAG